MSNPRIHDHLAPLNPSGSHHPGISDDRADMGTGLEPKFRLTVTTDPMGSYLPLKYWYTFVRSMKQRFEMVVLLLMRMTLPLDLAASLTREWLRDMSGCHHMMNMCSRCGGWVCSRCAMFAYRYRPCICAPTRKSDRLRALRRVR